MTATVAVGQAVGGESPRRAASAINALKRRLAEADEQQAATSEILRVISQSPRDVQPVFEAIATAALKLCGAALANVFRFDGELIHLAAVKNVNADAKYLAAIHSVFPRPPGRDTGAGRAILTRSLAAIPDVIEDRDYAIGPQTLLGGFRSVLAVPLMREEEAIGAIAVCLAQPGEFPVPQIRLLTTFAQQAVIAIENVRLFNETKEALEQQTATGEILKVISSSPTDVQPVFEAIAQRAATLSEAMFSYVTTFDGEWIHLRATWGPGTEGHYAFYPIRPGSGAVSARVIRDRAAVQIPDVLADPDYAQKESASATGFRSAAGVPMMREGKVVGTIAVARPDPGIVPDKLMRLLQTFADQAAIAIENVRLFNAVEDRNRDLTVALDKQTATSEILRVISSTQTDLGPVFDSIVRAAVRLSGADYSVAARFDGEMLHPLAFHGFSPEALALVSRMFPMAPGRINMLARSALTRSVVVVPDMLADSDYDQGYAQVGGWRSGCAVPMIRDGNLVGVIGISRSATGGFPDHIVQLLQTFADQAVIAIENVRLFTELEARTNQVTRSVEELRALGEVGRAVSSTLDLETVLSTIVSRATALAGVDAGAIYEYDEARGEFHLHTADRLEDEVVVALRAGPIRKGEGALGRMAMTGEPAQIRDIMTDAGYQSRLRETVLRLGYRSLMAVPLMRDDHLLGGLVVYRKTAGDFDAPLINLLKTFATQSALAIQNARLFREIEVKSRELEAASRHKSEFLANMSHELRTPLNAIIGFSEVLSERMFGEINEKQAEYVGDILESGRHLLSLINDILDLSKIEAGRMELELSDFDLPSAIQNTLILVRERAQRRAITLRCKLDERLGTIRADERKVKQVLLNLLSNALKFTPDGGRIDVRAAVCDGTAEISVTDTGVGIAPEDQETVFEEFRQVGTAAKKVEGTGLGLAISRKFIELHGGRIWVQSEVGAGSAFAFNLPFR